MDGALIYIRLSDKDQSNYSIPDQERETREYCNRHNLNVVKVYIDNGESSYTFDRADFRQLEKDIKHHKPQYIIVKHLDRFSRNMAEAMIKIKDLLAAGVKVRDVTEPFDMDDNSQTAFILRTIRFMTAEVELKRINERTTDGLIQAARSGRHTHMAPKGYKNARDGNNKPVLVIDEEKAPIIRLLFREYLAGTSLAELHKIGNRYGLHLYGNSSIRRVLSNHIYAGLIKVKAYKGEPEKYVKGLHEPLIDEPHFWKAQNMLQGKTLLAQLRDEVPLRGVLHQQNGRLYTAGKSTGKLGAKYWYYIDQDTRKTYSAIKLHQQLFEILDCLSVKKEALEHLKVVITGKLETYLQTRSSQLDQLAAELAIIEKRILTTEEKYLKSEQINPATFNRIMKEMRDDKARVQLELSSLTVNEDLYWDKLSSVLLHLADVKGGFEQMSLAAKHRFINTVFDNQLGYWDDSYTTPFIHPLFKANLQKINKKGLLKICSPVRDITNLPLVPEQGTKSNTIILSDIVQIADLFAVGNIAI